jgi:hypothetical protein
MKDKARDFEISPRIKIWYFILHIKIGHTIYLTRMAWILYIETKDIDKLYFLKQED